MPTKPLRTYQAHVYLTETEAAKLREIGDREDRSIGKQIAYYVREGLKREKVK